MVVGDVVFEWRSPFRQSGGQSGRRSRQLEEITPFHRLQFIILGNPG